MNMLLCVPTALSAGLTDSICSGCRLCCRVQYLWFSSPCNIRWKHVSIAYYLSDYSLGRYLCTFLTHTLAVVAVYLPLSFMRSLCVLDTGPVSDTCFANIFSYSVIYSFVLLALLFFIYKSWFKESRNNVFLYISYLWCCMRKVVTAAKVI